MLFCEAKIGKITGKSPARAYAEIIHLRICLQNLEVEYKIDSVLAETDDVKERLICSEGS